ncbi:MAG: TIGR04283 family arsenosugar biosynthesis glycosyltransferase [Alphaproteobacteria bacterium]
MSAVMPVLNEEASIAGAIRDAHSSLGSAEVIVVDGGSSDKTVENAKDCDVSVISSPRGRARQMNAGAGASSGDILLFLHADTRLPPNADRLIVAAINGGALWGRFDVMIAGRHPGLKVVARLMNIRSRFSGIATGDQAIFVTRQAFEAVGGFPDQPLMEDIDLSRRLLAMSKPACLRERVTTSGRRWDTHGFWRTVFLMWRLRFDHWLGADPAKLAHRYGYAPTAQ